MKAAGQNGKTARKGFTLVESIVALAVFSIAALMFAAILFTATGMVQYSLVYDSDREKLMEAIAHGYTESTEDITVTVVDSGSEDADYEQLVISLTGGNTLVADGKYVIYTVRSTGRKYHIFVGESTATNPSTDDENGTGSGG